MIVTARCAKWLQALPDADSAALLDAAHEAAADPLANPRHCKHLASRLYEARVSLPPSRQYRLMFAFRPDGAPVLLSACLKKSTADHERAIRAARAALASDEPLEGAAMPQERPIFTPESGWLYSSDGRQLRITHATRKKIIVQTDAGPVELKRSNFERDGIDYAGGIAYRTTKYRLPSEAQELAS